MIRTSSHSRTTSAVQAKITEGNESRSLQVHRVSDGDLLRAFLQQRSEAAFTELVNRFGPLVYGIVLRTLRDQHAAEDAFQATFLVLARDGKKIRSADSIGAWLHGTAVRTAKTLLKRRNREVLLEAPMQLIDDSTLADINEQFEHQLLDEELQKLPESYRSAIVLHFLEGKTCEETAIALRTTVGSIRGRLQRGKRELHLRLLKRGAELSAVLASITLWQSIAEASVHTKLAEGTIEAGMAMVQGTPFPGVCSPEAVQLATKEIAMFTKFKVLTTCAVLTITTAIGWFAHAGLASSSSFPSEVPTNPNSSPEFHTAIDELTTVHNDGVDVQFSPDHLIKEQGSPSDESPKAEESPILQDELAYAGDSPQEPARVLKYGDGTADGKKSIAGTGEAILFTRPDASQKLRSVKIHCARYGFPQAPNEDVEISIVSNDGTDVIHTELVPYSKFKRGESRWTTLAFEEDITVPEQFWVIFNFDAARTKGVFVSYDTSTKGEYSRTGLPGAELHAVTTGGDWMIQAILTKAE